MNISISFLKKMPIKKNKNFLATDYWQNKNHYQKNTIPQIKIDINNSHYNEKLSDCNTSGILGQNYYLKSPLLKNCPQADQYLSTKIYLRESILLSLKKIDEFLLHHKIRLFILSGYRHPQLQTIIFNNATGKYGLKKTKQFLANPKFYSPHASGSVFDIELFSQQTKKIIPLKMTGSSDRYFLENQKNLSLQEKEILGNRRLIHNLLSTDCILQNNEVFIPHPFEYWHYGRNERLSSFFNGDNHPVYYDEIY